MGIARNLELSKSESYGPVPTAGVTEAVSIGAGASIGGQITLFS
jgi:hypothetical protein